jgi:regulator of cell morphogenesis and NO signaling
MTAITTKTVREIVLEHPGAAELFEKAGIDYCCGGATPLDEACQNAGASVDQIEGELAALAKSPSTARNWEKEPLTELVRHINAKHHAFVREAVPRISARLEKVCGKHGENHPELNQITAVFHALGEELHMHLMKEENILFPYVESIERAQETKEPPAQSCFGTVQNPIRMMMMEHDSAGSALRSIRQASQNYQVPADACTSFQLVYRELQEFEADLHQHIHLENNVLFPRTLQLERTRTA